MLIPIIRQAWKQITALSGASLAVGLIAPLNDLAAGVWALATLVIGVLCGTRVFAHKPDQHHASMGPLWLVRTGFWLMTASAMSLLIAVTFLWRLIPSEASKQLPWARVLATPIWEPQGIGFVLVLWLIVGLSVGQFFGMLCRKNTFALITSLVVGLVISLLWVPSLAGDGMHVWQVLASPLILLLTTRLSMRAWLAGSTKRLLFLGGALATVCLGFSLWYRVAEIPDVGPPFDVAAFQAEIASGDKSQGPQAIKNSIQKMEAREKELTEYRETKVTYGEIDETARILGGVVSQAGPNGMMPLATLPFLCRDQRKRDDFVIMPPQAGRGIIRYDALENGWQANDKESAKALDLLFNNPWIEHLRQSLEFPPGTFFGPGSTASSDQENRLAYECTIAARYLAIRALMWQAHGDNKRALNELATALRLSRHMRSRATMQCYFWGLTAEGYALTGLERWLKGLDSDPFMLRQAIDELDRHEKALPPFGDSLKLEYLALLDLGHRGKLQWNPFDLEMWVVGGGSVFTAETELAMIRNTPWEKSRFERILNLLFAGWLRACEADYSQILVPYLEFRDGEIPRFWLGEWLPSAVGPGSKLTPEDAAKFSGFWPLRGIGVQARNRDRFGWTCNLRATRLKLILALYQLNEKRPPPSLEALVPEYMSEVPIDPYSGKPFRYRVSNGENITEQFFEDDGLRFPFKPKERIRYVPANQGILWSVGLDGIDNGGMKHGVALDPSEWMSKGLDEIFVIPRWPLSH